MKKTKVLIIITLIILIAIFITGGFLILNSLSKKNSSGGNVGEISDTESNKEETWSSQNLDDEEYYYYPTQTAIKRIRRDTMDYKTIYLSEDTSRCQIDAEMVTIYGDYIYFFRTDYIYGDSHNKIYSFIIGRRKP